MYCVMRASAPSLYSVYRRYDTCVITLSYMSGAGRCVLRHCRSGLSGVLLGSCSVHITLRVSTLSQQWSTHHIMYTS